MDSEVCYAKEKSIHREIQTARGCKALPSPGKARDEEIAATKRELARVKSERDFLKEAAAFFVRESKWSTEWWRS